MKNKIIHIPEKFGFRHSWSKEFPEMILVGMSFICNARCIHCPNAATNFEATLKGKDSFMDWNVLKQISLQSKDYPTLLRISSFGEILMHPEAIDMIIYLLKNKPDKNIALTTNGSLLTAEKSKILMENGIRSIEFSVDAHKKEIYEKIRCGLKWENVLKNIEDCVKIRNKNNFSTKIMLSVIEQKLNEEYIEEIFKFWKNKVDKVLIRKLLSFKGLIKREKEYNEYMTETTPCPFLWERVVVDPKGNVRGCVSDIYGELVLGNILEKPMKELWHSEEIENYRRKHLAGDIKNCPLCKECVDVKYRSWNYNYFYALDDKKNDDK